MWGEGGIERREGDVEMKEVLEEGRKGASGSKELEREIQYVCVG